MTREREELKVDKNIDKNYKSTLLAVVISGLLTGIATRSFAAGAAAVFALAALILGFKSVLAADRLRQSQDKRESR